MKSINQETLSLKINIQSTLALEGKEKGGGGGKVHIQPCFSRYTYADVC